MKNYKGMAGFVLAIALVMGVLGCSKKEAASGGAASPAQASPAASAPAQSAAVPVVTEWARENRIDDGSQTPEELYELAKQEGQVTVYSISSRITSVKTSFEKQYPGVIVNAYDINSNELYEKVSREYDAGVHNADVVHIKDEDGAIYIDDVLPGKFNNYYPSDIAAHIPPDARKYSMPLYVELSQWFYNSELFDAPPVSSWWDLTKPEWKGKLVLQDPLSANTYLFNFAAFVQNSDLFAADYEKVFGKPVVLPPDCPTVGHYLIKCLSEQDLIFESSSDRVCEAVGAAGTTSKLLGWAASSKLRKNESDGWKLAPINITPGTSMHNTNNLYIVDQAPHPNAAKLLIRWMVGEADGKGAGFNPFNTLGGWSVRDDVTPAPGNPMLADLYTLPGDPNFLYANVPDVKDFWIGLQTK